MSPQFKLMAMMVTSFCFLVLTSFIALDAISGDTTLISEVKDVVTDNKILTALILSEILAFVPAKVKGIVQGAFHIIGKLIPRLKKRVTINSNS